MSRDPATGAPARASIDWPDIHRRMERLRQAVERGWAPDAEEAARILRERARALAVAPPDDVATDDLEIVEFVLGDEHYGVASAYVREVLPLSDLTHLPCAPDFVLGIISVRGEIVSVLDLAKFLGLPGRGFTDLNQVLILESERMCFGVLANVVAGVRQIDAAALQPSLPTLSGANVEFLCGIGPSRLIVLDAQQLLSSPAVVVHENTGT